MPQKFLTTTHQLKRKEICRLKVNRSFATLLTFGILFFVLTYLLFYQPWEQTINITQNNTFMSSSNGIKTKEKRYLTTHKYRGKLANMIYRCASLYGIGRSIGRQPYILKSKEFGIFNEFTNIFPGMKKAFEIISHQNFTEKIVNFGYNDCCRFESPSNLEKYNDTKYIKLQMEYLQSYKYFENYQTDLKILMQCSPNLKKEAKMEAKKIWSNDFSSHKICAHIRRGDFVKVPTLVESTYEFIYPAINFIHKQLQQKSLKNISLLIFGDDFAFSKNLTFPKMFTSTTILKDGKGDRAFDMCFSIEYCDTFLLSASSSSFGWWIGYLLKSQGTVYYDAEIAKSASNSKVRYESDGFPTYWKKLRLLKNGDIQLIENLHNNHSNIVI